jgi:N-acyl-L-homoserine lactone synthetase
VTGNTYVYYKQMGIMRRTRHTLSDFYTYWRLFKREPNVGRYTVSIAKDGSEELLAAKKLHAGEYLARGFIEEQDITNGIIHERSDPYQKHATYFVVKNRRNVVGVARQIVYKGSGNVKDSFPILDKANIYSRYRTKIESQHPRTIVEISALVKKRGESSIVPIVLYRSLWQYSRKHGHSYWIMACDERLYHRLRMLFGPAILQIGKLTPYFGGDVVPAALHIPSSEYYLKEHSSSKRKVFTIRNRAASHMLRKDKV